jgi:hypothetical protein
MTAPFQFVYHLPNTATAAFALAARLGFRAVALTIADDADAEATQRALAAAAPLYGLRISDLRLNTPRLNMEDAATQQAALAHIRTWQTIAAAVGAQGLSIRAGVAHAADDTAAWERTTSALAMLSNGTGGALRVYAHAESMVSDVAGLARLRAAVPSLALCVDGVLLSGKGGDAEWAAVLPHTTLVTLPLNGPAKALHPARISERLGGWRGDVCLSYAPSTSGVPRLPDRRAANLTDALAAVWG